MGIGLILRLWVFKGETLRRVGTVSLGDSLSAKQTLEAVGRIPVCVRSRLRCG